MTGRDDSAVPAPAAGLVQRLRPHARQFVKFAIVGASGTVVNLVVLKLTLLAWSAIAGSAPFGAEIFASSLAFAVSVVNNFLLNRWWTFRSTGPIHAEFGKFLTVSLIGLGINELCFYLLRGELGLHVMLSQLLAIACVLPFNYLANRLWSFKDA